MDVVPADTMSVREEDPIFCGVGDHGLTYDILNIMRGFPNLCIYVRFQCVMPHIKILGTLWEQVMVYWHACMFVTCIREHTTWL